MSLTNKEKDYYLKSVVIKSFNLLQHSKVSAYLYFTDGTLIAITDSAKEEFGLDSLLRQCKSEDELTDEDIVNYTGFDGINYIKAIREAAAIVYKLRKIAIENKSTLSFVSLIPRHGEYKPRLMLYLPILHESGEVVAIQSIQTNYCLFNLFKYFDEQNEKFSLQMVAAKTINFPIHLSKRQHEILFLLTIGQSQRQAAEILNISRGNLARITADDICPKFGIFDGNTTKLIEKAIKMNYRKYMPQTLFYPKIIIVDQNIIEKYFNE